MLLNIFKKWKKFIDPINPEEFGDNIVILANKENLIPKEYKKYKVYLTEWHVKEGDFIHKSQSLFTLELRKKNKKNVSIKGSSPVNGRLLKITPENIKLEVNQNCCVIKAVSDEEILENYYNIKLIEEKSSKLKDGKTQFFFREDSMNKEKTYGSVYEYYDEFLEKNYIESSTMDLISFKDDIRLTFKFQQEENLIWLVLNTHRKHFRWKLNSSIHFLFEDKSKITLKVEKEGKRYDKNSDGIIFQVKIKLSDTLLNKFCTTPLNKWKLEEEGTEIIGGMNYIIYDEGFHKRQLLLIANAFKMKKEN